MFSAAVKKHSEGNLTTAVLFCCFSASPLMHQLLAATSKRSMKAPSWRQLFILAKHTAVLEKWPSCRVRVAKEKPPLYGAVRPCQRQGPCHSGSLRQGTSRAPTVPGHVTFPSEEDPDRLSAPAVGGACHLHHQQGTWVASCRALHATCSARFPANVPPKIQLVVQTHLPGGCQHSQPGVWLQTGG